MIKHYRKTKLHAIGWLAILLIAFWTTGCAEKLAPEVETQTEEQIETTSTEITEPEVVSDFDDQGTVESSFTDTIESNPNTFERAVLVEEPEETVQENTQIEVMDLTDDVFVDEKLQEMERMDSDETPGMENTAEVFENVGETPEAIEEAKLLSFSDATQIEDVYFGFDSYGLDSKSQDLLRANADWLQQNPNAQVEIQGHCDERGTNNYNLGLA